MKKYVKINLLILVHFAMLQMSSQSLSTKTVNNDILGPYNEQVYVHTNTNIIFVGEYLYYTIYCLKQNGGNLSDLSKIAYLKLVNQKKEVVFNKKIKLKNGIGDSSFFIPSNLPSGNYKLIAYTQWMLNQGSDYFFSEDITVINPYTSNQSEFLKDKTVDSIIIGTERSTPAVSTEQTAPMIIEMNRSEYSVREQVSLKIKAEKGQLSLGNYSISVRKKESLQNGVKSSVLDFTKVYPPQDPKFEVNNLPELRGELLSGQVFSQNEIGSLENIVVGVSFPGEDYLFKIGTTNKEGKFYINIPEAYDTPDAYMQILSGHNELDSIVILPQTALDFTALEFKTFQLKPEMGQIIKDRSVHIQIENAYYGSKPDTILLKPQNKLFYNSETTTYHLDDYTRFPTVKETFVEVVEHVWLSKNTENRLEFHVRPIAPFIESGKLPMVFVDGFLVLDHEWILNLPAKQIKKIRISRNKHFYGTYIFQGIVDFYTVEGDYYKSYYSDIITKIALFKPDERKNYFRQNYHADNKEMQDRLPDFRYQLLWLPDYNFNGQEEVISFFTSDVVGEYEIVLEGFSDAGRPVSICKTFSVN